MPRANASEPFGLPRQPPDRLGPVGVPPERAHLNSSSIGGSGTCGTRDSISPWTALDLVRVSERSDRHPDRHQI